jgi:hypothetical protein
MCKHWHAFNLIEPNVLHLWSVHTVASCSVNTLKINYTNVTLIGIHLITASHDIIFVISENLTQQPNQTKPN